MNAKKKAHDEGVEDTVFEDVQKGGWSSPPDDVLDRARRVSRDDVLPPPDPAAVEECRPADVRAAASALDGGDEIVITRSHEDADLTITVQAPNRESEWRIEGRIWLRDALEKPIKIALVHEEHVLSVHEVENGEYFELEETLPRHWHLEAHLPSGTCLRVDDVMT